MQQGVDSTLILYKQNMAPTPAFWNAQILHGICKYCLSNNHRLNLVDSNHRVPDTGLVYWRQSVGDYFNRRQSGNRSRADTENKVVVRYIYCGIW
jgi:hypothetical protein